MRLALREAAKGLGRTSPNPCVGAIVVKDGKVIAKGFHRQVGLPHAEPEALQAAGVGARGATLYVTLEPCNHTGRTPPCTEAILKSGVARVVIGMPDPNPGVAGGGASCLADRGIKVTSGVLEEECRNINLPFIKHCTTGLPWVIMKAGMSLDGRIAAARGQCTSITSSTSRLRAHRLRDRVDGILVGVDTVLTDDPALTTRLPGRRKGRDPLRIVLDTNLRMPAGARMLHQASEAATWIFCGPEAPIWKKEQLREAGAVIKSVSLDRASGRLDLRGVLRELGRAALTSILVEGGGSVHGAFLQEGLVDQVVLFIAPVFLGTAGVPVVIPPDPHKPPAYGSLHKVRARRFGDDLMIEGIFV